MPVVIQNVLVPIDLSPAGDRVCDYAAEVAQRFRPRLTVLHVVEGVEELRGMNLPSISYEDLVPDLEARAQDNLQKYVANRFGADDDVDLRVTHGEPYVRILEVAEAISADLIVMATHGRKGLDRAIFGSTTERVMRSATCPVLAIPFKEETS
jgi:nucleotide-binding universal stress UspA family protein